MIINSSFDRPLPYDWRFEWETIVQTVLLLATSRTTLIASWMFWKLYPSEDIPETADDCCEGKLWS